MFVIQKASIRNYNKSLTMKTTTNTVKIQKFSGKVREIVEAIYTMRFSLKCLSMIQ